MKLHHHWLKACDCQVIANEDAVSFCVFAAKMAMVEMLIPKLQNGTWVTSFIHTIQHCSLHHKSLNHKKTYSYYIFHTG